MSNKKSNFQFNNNGNNQFVENQGETHYNGPVTKNYYGNRKSPLSPVSRYIRQYVNANDSETTIDSAAVIVFAEINEIASEAYKQVISKNYQSLNSKEDKISCVSKAITNLLNDKQNRNATHSNNKGIFSGLKKNLKTPLKSLKNKQKACAPQQEEVSASTDFIIADYDYEDEDEDEDDTKQIDSSPPNEYGSSFRDFNHFMFKKELMRAIDDAVGFECPSQVQRRTIPPAISGHDIIVQAKSRMGKSIAFILSTLTLTQSIEDVIDTLVLVPYNEMALQIFSEFERFSKYMADIQISCVYGGIPFVESKRVILEEKPHILIGTPGTIARLLENKVLELGRLRRFIIDECDDILYGIDGRKQVEYIFKRTPQNKQVMLFSAIINESSKAVCKIFTKNALEISIDDDDEDDKEEEEELTLNGLQQHFVKILETEKNTKLTHLLNHLNFNQVVVFVRTNGTTIATQINCLLSKCAFPSICVHSGMGETERLSLFKAFNQYKHRILVVSANLFECCVDIERVNIVINYDMPQDSDEYLDRMHRFTTKGLAITFVTTDDECVLKKIQERVNVKLTPLPNQIPESDYM